MKKQLEKGKKGEKELDDFFSKDWDITPLSREHERKGLGDRFYKSKKDPSKVFHVEYKTDEEAARTGNIFVETISVDTHHKQGWALTCQADFIFIYIPDKKVVFIVKPDGLKNKLLSWHTKYPIRPCDKKLNNGYVSYGVLVSTDEIEKISKTVSMIDSNKNSQTNQDDIFDLGEEIGQVVNNILASGWV